MRFEQVHSVGQYPTDVGCVDEYAFFPGPLLPDGFKQLPCTHAVKIPIELDMKITGAVAKIDVESSVQLMPSWFSQESAQFYKL